MEELNITNNFPLSCGYCSFYLGTLGELMATNSLTHPCLEKFDNVTLDVENKKVWGINAEISNNGYSSPEFVNEYSAPDSSKEASALVYNQECKKQILSLECSKDFFTKYNNEISIPGCNKKPPTPSCSKEAPTSACSKENWTYEATKLLIVTYKENRYKFESPQYNKKAVWEIISEKMKENKIYKSGDKCFEKWRNLKKTYEKTLKERNSTGNSNVFWIFFDDLHEIFFKDPHFNPVFTINSTGFCKKRNCTETQHDTSSLNEINKDENSNKKMKAKENRDIEKKALQFTLTDIENRRQKRHQEKMKLKEEIFQWFKDNFKKD